MNALSLHQGLLRPAVLFAIAALALLPACGGGDEGSSTDSSVLLDVGLCDLLTADDLPGADRAELVVGEVDGDFDGVTCDYNLGGGTTARFDVSTALLDIDRGSDQQIVDDGTWQAVDGYGEFAFANESGGQMGVWLNGSTRVMFNAFPLDQQDALNRAMADVLIPELTSRLEG